MEIYIVRRCNPCYNGNDLQASKAMSTNNSGCNPCYNGNDLQGIMGNGLWVSQLKSK